MPTPHPNTGTTTLILLFLFYKEPIQLSSSGSLDPPPWRHHNNGENKQPPSPNASPHPTLRRDNAPTPPHPPLRRPPRTTTLILRPQFQRNCRKGRYDMHTFDRKHLNMVLDDDGDQLRQGRYECKFSKMQKFEIMLAVTSANTNIRISLPFMFFFFKFSLL